MIDTKNLRPEQLEALARFRDNPSLGIHSPDLDTESQIELEAYVAESDAAAA